jgi:hypothetical protein
MKPRLCKAGVTLREWVNEQYPSRDKRSDGWIGDPAHRTRISDHNPDPVTGVVRAIDIDADLRANRPDESARLAEILRQEAKQGLRPISYIIHQAKICSAKTRWAWKPYDGVNLHYHHLHVSFKKVRGE